MDLPSASPEVSMDFPYGTLPDDYSEFELTLVGGTGLHGTSVWSKSQGGYVTVTIDRKQIYETHLSDSGREPQWNETFRFISKRSHNLTISVHAIDMRGFSVLVGQIEERLTNVDRAGKDVNRMVSSMHHTRPFTLNFRFEPRRRMFAFIVAIDEYKSEKIPNLQGCKSDAQSVVDLLSHKFRVPSSHFLCLANERATRRGIIHGFRKHLIQNKNIEYGDAIVIFYAGHGSWVPAPEGWVTDYNRVETICPHDERTTCRDGEEIFSIPDRTLGGLLRRVSSIKGNNITVIVDSCHSSGVTRGPMVRGVSNTAPLPADIDENIWTWGLSGSEVLTGFLDNTMSSHVLFAACQRDEFAHEDSSEDNVFQGAFTRVLVQILDQENDLTKITNLALINLLPPLEHQHPQCNGKNRDRILFNGLAGTHPTTFRLSRRGETYFAEAGDVHGVVEGTLFAIHACHNISDIDRRIGILEADVVYTQSCRLRWPREDKRVQIPPNARVSVLDWRHREPVLKVFIQHPHITVQPTNAFSLVDSPDSADLVLCHPSETTWQFERLDPIISKYAPVLNNIWLKSGLPDTLQGISLFNFHLSRNNNKNPLNQKVEVVLHRLMHSNPDQHAEEAIYMPDGSAGMPLALDRENTVFITAEAMMDYNSDGVFYGLTIKNNSGRKLFPYLMKFDPSDYSIQSWYHPPAETMEAPLRPRHDDGRAYELKVGYGEAGVKAVEFSLADGLNEDVTFLKLIVSTVYVDMSVLEQSSPFLVSRGGDMGPTRVRGIWDAWTYAIKTKKQGRRRIR